MRRAVIALSVLTIAAASTAAKEPLTPPTPDACQAGDCACAKAEKDGLSYLKAEGAQMPVFVKSCGRIYSSYSALARCVRAYADNVSPDFQFPDRSAKSICDDFYVRKPDAVLRQETCVEREISRRADLLAVWDKLPSMTRYMCGWGIIGREEAVPLYTAMTICVGRETEKAKGNDPGPFTVPPECLSQAELTRSLRK
jgi:hypothetical protein